MDYGRRVRGRRPARRGGRAPDRRRGLLPAGRPEDSAMLGARLGGAGYGFVRPPGGARAPMTQGGAAPRMPIPGDALPIVVDANAALDAMRVYTGAFGGSVRKVAIADRYMGRLVIPGKARDEIDDVMGRGGSYDTGLLRRMEGMYDDSEPDAGCLERLEGMHRAAAADPDSDDARQWLWAKRTYLQQKHGIEAGAAGDEARRALKELYDDARSDRVIAAQAAAVAARGRGAYLLTSDGDFLAFRDRIRGIAGGLDVRRPEAAA